MPFLLPFIQQLQKEQRCSYADTTRVLRNELIKLAREKSSRVVFVHDINEFMAIEIG